MADPTPLAAEEPWDDYSDLDDESECDCGEDTCCCLEPGLDGPDPGEECGRWWGGKLGRSCTKAGSEECDFECPYRGSLYG